MGIHTAHALFVGRTTLDALYWLDELPQEDTKAFARAFRLTPGGPACNAAITHAVLGGRATLLTAVGCGPAADLIRTELDRRGIQLVDLAAGTSYETPLTTVLINATDATRTIINPPAAEFEMSALPDGWNTAWGERPQIALTDGFHLAETLPVISSLRDSGVPICFDGGSWKPGTDKLAALLTAAICSERFALPNSMPDPGVTMDWFAGLGVPYAAVTRGARPILCLDRGRCFEIPIRPVEAIDTTGAGDVLHGAFCFHFAMTRNFEESMKRAAEVATRSCEDLGITHWVDAMRIDPRAD